MKGHFLNGTILMALAVAVLLVELRNFMTSYGQSAKTNSIVATNDTSPENWKLMEEYFAALRTNNIAQARELGRKSLVQATNDWKALNFLSWRIFTDRHIKHRDRELSMIAAQRALELTREKDPDVLDTYARALWENGKQADAIRYQKKAVELCKVEGKRIEMEANLNRYVRLSRQKTR